MNARASLIERYPEFLLVTADSTLMEAVQQDLREDWPDAPLWTASSNHDGLAEYLAHEPSIVFVDLAMPDPRDFELVLALRDCGAPAVVALAPQGQPVLSAQALAQGVDSLVGYPWARLALNAHTREVLRRVAAGGRAAE